MKIGHTSSAAADAATLARASAETGAAAAKARGAQQGDGAGAASSVKLSSAAAGLMSEAGSVEFDAAKVERVKQAIADGSYRVDAEAIADKLIANAAEVLGAVKR